MKKILITENQFKSLIDESTIKPIIAYHGTNNKIDKFVTDFVGGKNEMGQEGPGIYFTTKEDDAYQYGNYVHKVLLKPRKLLSDKTKRGITVNDIVKLIKMNKNWQMNAMDWAENPMVGLKLSIDAILDEVNAKDIITQIYIEYYRYEPIDYVNNATKIGVDGIIVQKEWGANHIIVYNPNIIEIIND